MSKQDATKPENIKIMLLKGQKGDAGETYDDTEIRNLIRGQNAAISDLADLVNSFDGLAILRDIATVENEINEESTHNYEIGEYLVFNSQLYQVTQTIQIGDELEENINITATNVGDVLENLAKKQFDILYETTNKTTVTTKDGNGNIITIVETDSNAVATSTFVTSGSITTITTTIVPVRGEYNYVKTTTIENTSTTRTITESYTIIAKEEE